MNLGHWQFLSGFFRMSFVKLFISWFAIVPVAVSILRGIPDIIYVNASGRSAQIALHFSLPFSWIALWIASLLFSIAAILFHLYCPKFIKRHNDWIKYKSIGHSPRWIVWELYYHLEHWGHLKKYSNSKDLREVLISKEMATIVDKIPREPKANEIPACVIKEPEKTTLYFESDGKNYKISSDQAPGLNDNTENDIFWELFGFLAKSFPSVRKSINILLLISGALVAFVVLQNIYFAGRYILESAGVAI